MNRRNLLAHAGASILGTALPGLAWANQDWPTKPVRLVVPVAAGGGQDALGRILADKLRTGLGQAVFVDNRPGAGAILGTGHVAKSPADGYTFLLTANTHVLNAGLHKTLPFDPIGDFEPVSLLATSPQLMAVKASLPVRNMNEFIELAKKKPGELSYGSAGVGSPGHVAAAMLEDATGIKMIHAPYKSAGLVANALLGGEITTAIGAVNGLLPHIRSGALRAIATVDGTRASLLPDVATVAEQLRLPNFAMSIWYAVFAPAGTPRHVVDRMNSELRKIVLDPALRNARLSEMGFESVGSTADELGRVVKLEIPKYKKVMESAKIAAD